MLKQLFEHEFSAKLSMEMLAPKFFKMRQEEKAIITRRMVTYEYKGTIFDKDFFRKETLALMLYEHMLYPPHSAELHGYVTQDIKIKETATRILTQYKQRERSDPLYKPMPVFVENYFRTPKFINICGPLDIKKSSIKSSSAAESSAENTELDINFMERIDNLITAKKCLKQIFGNVLAKQMYHRIEEEKSKGIIKNGISEKDYLEFDISSVLGNTDELITKTLETQIGFLHHYLLGCWGSADRSTDVMEVLRELQKVLHLIVTCSTDEEKAVKELIEWGFLRLCIVHDIEKADKSQLSDTKKQALDKFVVSLKPNGLKDVVIPDKDAQAELLPQVVKEHLKGVSKRILGRTLPKAVGMLYYEAQFWPTPQTFYQSQEKFIEREIARITPILAVASVDTRKALEDELSRWEMALVAVRAEMIHPSLGTVITKKNDIVMSKMNVMLLSSSDKKESKEKDRDLDRGFDLTLQLEQKVRIGVEIRQQIKKFAEMVPTSEEQKAEILVKKQELDERLKAHLTDEQVLRVKLFPKLNKPVAGGEGLLTSQNQEGFVAGRKSSSTESPGAPVSKPVAKNPGPTS